MEESDEIDRGKLRHMLVFERKFIDGDDSAAAMGLAVIIDQVEAKLDAADKKVEELTTAGADSKN